MFPVRGESSFFLRQGAGGGGTYRRESRSSVLGEKERKVRGREGKKRAREEDFRKVKSKSIIWAREILGEGTTRGRVVGGGGDT